VKSKEPGPPPIARLVGLLGYLLASSPVAAQSYEDRLSTVAGQIQHGQVEQALLGAQSLVEQYPGGRAARLIYADLLASRAGALTDVGAGARSADNRELLNLRQEISARWKRASGELAAFDNRLPDSLIQASRNTGYVLFADLRQSRLFVFANREGTLELIRDFYVTHGLNGSGKQIEGDQRTPIGVYFVTGYIPGNTLPSRYGPGALPISYPNSMDIRRQRTGYGIWIHGTEPYLLNRSPMASDGCLSLNNDDFQELNSTLNQPTHTPVIIDATPNWRDRSSLAKRRDQLLRAIEAWRSHWESTDANAFLDHYDATQFSDGKLEFDTWAGRKRAILDAKRKITVSITDIELFGYPGEDNVVLADFQQQFDSPTFTSTMRKQQYWKLGEDGRWRIIFEGPSEKMARPVESEDDDHDGTASTSTQIPVYEESPAANGPRAKG
jgi:murein L,D-transpeptidase YafK